MRTIITASQLTMSEVSCSVQLLKTCFFFFFFSMRRVKLWYFLCLWQGSTSTTSTEELKPIQIRHQDISTKNKTVTLLANVLQRLTEQTFCFFWQNVTKNYKSVCFVVKGDASGDFSAIKLHPNLSDTQETEWMWCWMLYSHVRYHRTSQILEHQHNFSKFK